MERKTHVRPLIILFLYNVLYMAASGLLVPGIPLYLLTNGFDGNLVNIILASIAMVSLLGQVIWGYFSDMMMTKLSFVELGTIGYTIGYLILTFLRDKFTIAIVLIISNFIGSASYPAAMALLADLSSVQSRGKSMGTFWSAASLGWATSVAFTGFIVEKLGGKYLFVLCFLMYAVSFLLVYFGFQESHQSTEVRRSTVKERKPILRSILSLEGSFLAFLLGSVIFFMADFVKNVYIPMFYAFELELGMTTATLLLSLTSWIELPTTILFGSLSDKIGRKRVVLIGYILCGIYMFINSLAQGFGEAVLAMCLYGVIWGAFSGASSALASELVDESKRGFAMGLFNSSSNVASLLAPLSMGTLAQVLGYRPMFSLMGTFILTACLLLMLGVKEKASNSSDKQAEVY
ncbi:MAG: MFS transporter [Candidatus Brockarchaeota archaeon]|nr:MFS transporter [Candidatus Brockarchaeota archaeon]